MKENPITSNILPPNFNLPLKKIKLIYFQRQDNVETKLLDGSFLKNLYEWTLTTQ